MTPGQRRAHLRLWLVGGPVLIAIVVLSLALRGAQDAVVAERVQGGAGGAR